MGLFRTFNFIYHSCVGEIPVLDVLKNIKIIQQWIYGQISRILYNKSQNELKSSENIYPNYERLILVLKIYIIPSFEYVWPELFLLMCLGGMHCYSQLFKMHN